MSFYLSENAPMEGTMELPTAGESTSSYGTEDVLSFSPGGDTYQPQETAVTSGGTASTTNSPQPGDQRDSSPISHPRLGEVLRGFRKRDRLKDSEGFIPEGSLDDLIQPACVQEELRAQFPHDDLEELDILTERICRKNVGAKTYRRVFAISCLADAVGSLKALLNPRTGICDGDLPLAKHPRPGRKGFELRKPSALQTRLRCFSGWRYNQFKLFDDWQWAVLAPTLVGVSGDCHTFGRRIVLPLMSKSDSKDEGTNGGFSDVLKIQLHPQHHRFSLDDPDCFFALKRLKSGDDGIFEQELHMLGKFDSGNAHPHIVSLLTAWRQGDHSYFLFPWAKSDLLKYWEHHKPLKTSEYVRWVVKQMAGIADGLLKIHEYGHSGLPIPGTDEAIYGRHGDIKAENILWFEPSEGYGKLVISDFGLGTFNSRNSRSGIPNTGVPSTPTYRPPECNIIDGTVSRSWDIWTLGCLYAEFATWLLGGWRLFNDFIDWRVKASFTIIRGVRFRADTFFDLVDIQEGPDGQTMGKSAKIKPIVTWWLDGLHTHTGCPQYIHDLLKFVQEKMLIVESSDRQRAKCDEVVRELRRIQERCVLDEAYCTKPRSP